MKSFGKIKPIENIEIAELTANDIKEKFSSVIDNGCSLYLENKVRKDTEFKNIINRSLNNILKVFDSKRDVNYQNGRWVESSYLTTTFVYGTEEKNKISFSVKEIDSYLKSFVSGHTNKEEFLEVLKSFEKYMNLKVKNRYKFLGEEWDSEPSEETINKLIEKDNKEIINRRMKDEELVNLKNSLDKMDVDTEKGKFLSIFIGNNKELESANYNNIDLMKKALANKQHFSNWSRDEYDGPTYSGSQTYNIKGRYYVIPLKDDTKKYKVYDAWDIKKIIPFLEKDGLKCDFSTSSGSYGSRSYSLDVTDKEGKEHRFTSYSQSFGTGYLPKLLDGDDFDVVGIGYNKDTTNNSINSNDLTEGKTNSVESKEVESKIDNKELNNFGCSVTRNKEKNGIEIYFADKPSSDIIEKLKNNRFRWSFTNKCWYKKDNGETDKEIIAKIS